MSYIGNTLQTAFPSYLNIDDISGSFNGVTTSFALTVGGAAPVPAPVSSNQCLISVGGVVQRPDDTGAEGFRLSGGNIVFSSAPNTGEDFFGVVLAGADYLNVGVNYPSGTAAAPSITFDSDLDTGIYNPAANQLGFVTAGVSRATIDSSGNVNITNNLTVDTNTLFVDATNNRVGIGTTGPSQKLSVEGAADTYALVKRTVSGSESTILVGAESGKTVIYSRDNTTGGRALEFAIGTSAAARIDTSGRLLVGTSSTSVGSTAVFQGYNGGAGSAIIRLSNTSTTPTADLGYVVFGDGAQNEGASILGRRDGGTWTSGSSHPSRLVFSTTADGASSPTEHLRIRSDGILIWGNGSLPSSTNPGISFINKSYSYIEMSSGPDTSSRYKMTFLNGNGMVGRIETSGTSTSYVTTSDYRVKENVAPLTNAIERFNQLQVHRFNFIADPDTTFDGFIAHEAQAVVPECVTGEKDAVDDDGNPVYQGIDQSKLVPLLTAALQEAIGRIETLEAEVAALKGA